VAAEAIDAFVQRVQAIEGTPPGPGSGRGGRGAATPPSQADTLRGVRAGLAGLMNAMQAADVAPTENTRRAIANAHTAARNVTALWTVIRTTELAALNAILKKSGLAAITLPAASSK